MPRKAVKSLVFTTVLMIEALAARGGALGDMPREPAVAGDSLQGVFDRIHEHAKDDAWRKEGWKDEVIEKWLDQFVAALAKAGEIPELKLPVRQADVQPADPFIVRRTGSLLICKDFDRSMRGLIVRNSIVLADGNVDVLGPENSVIVARGVVNVTSAKNCVIVAGTAVTCAMDGAFGANNQGSIIVTRGWIDMGMARGSILVPGQGITAPSARDSVFVNVPVPIGVRPERHSGSRSVKALDLPLTPLPVHPLAAKIALAGVIQEPATLSPGGLPRAPRDLAPAGVVFRFSDRRYVAEINQPLVDEAGKPIEALSGWKLIFVNERLAVFGRGKEEAVVRCDEK